VTGLLDFGEIAPSAPAHSKAKRNRIGTPRSNLAVLRAGKVVLGLCLTGRPFARLGIQYAAHYRQAQPTQLCKTEQTVMKYRHRVLILLFFLSIITYLDRVCISVAGPRMQNELGISPERWGWVVGAFTLSYAIF
jgi:hypothetical protein